MKRCAASAAKVFGRGVGRTFLQKGFPTASDLLVRKEMPPGYYGLSISKVDNLSNFLSPVEVFWIPHLESERESLVVGKPFWKKCFPTPLPKTFSPHPADATVTGGMVLFWRCCASVLLMAMQWLAPECSRAKISDGSTWHRPKFLCWQIPTRCPW